MDFKAFEFSQVVDLPSDYEVYDFSQGYDPNRKLKSKFGVGKYNEKRPTMYSHSQYKGERNIHMGIDIAAPVNTPVKSFYNGIIHGFANNSTPGDYGYTLIVEYKIQSKKLYALYGHLSEKSVATKVIGQEVDSAEIIAWVGDRSENGGWNPHLHFQLSWVKPKKIDMAGVVSEVDRDKALEIYPDPQLVLGELYEA